MASIPMDLDYMVLERLRHDSLTHASKVNQKYREYISKHKSSMRSFPSVWIEIICSNVPRIAAYKSADTRGEFIREIQREKGICRIPCSEYTLLHSIDALVKYRTTKLEIDEAFPVSQSMNDRQWTNLINQLMKLPRWWFEALTEVHLFVGEDFPLMALISRLSTLHRFRLTMTSQTAIDLHLKKIIKRMPKVTEFLIRWKYFGPEMIVDDSFLEAIMIKSWIHPIGFPIFSIESRFSLTQIIRFIELVTLCPLHLKMINNINYYWFCVTSPVKGKRKDWKDWVHRNGTPVFVPGIKVKLNKNCETFIFREAILCVDLCYFTEQ